MPGLAYPAWINIYTVCHRVLFITLPVYRAEMLAFIMDCGFSRMGGNRCSELTISKVRAVGGLYEIPRVSQEQWKSCSWQESNGSQTESGRLLIHRREFVIIFSVCRNGKINYISDIAKGELWGWNSKCG